MTKDRTIIDELREATVALKRKLMVGIIVIVIVLGSLNIIDFIILRMSMIRLDEMIESIILANNLIIKTGTPTVGLPKLLEKYSLYPTLENRKMITGQLEAMERDIEIMQSLVKDEEGKIYLEGVYNMTQAYKQSYLDVFDMLPQLLEERNFAEANRMTELVDDGCLFLAEGIREFITVELTYHDELKNELDRNSTIFGIVIILTILAVSILSIILANRYSKDIIKPIERSSKIIQDAQRVAKMDMDMAIGVQKALMPLIPPKSKMWDVSYMYRPVAGISGDVYDFYSCDGELKGVSIFDVSGHGISAGLVTIIAKATTSNHFKVQECDRLGAMLRDINREIINEVEDTEHYMTGIILRLFDNYIEYVNAGHTDPIYKNTKMNKAVPIKFKDKNIKGPFVGIDMGNNDREYESIKFRVNKGDFLVLYTDGLTGSRNKNGEEYGLDRLIKCMQEVPGDDVHIMLDYIKKDFYSFVDESMIKDDITVILLKRKD